MKIGGDLSPEVCFSHSIMQTYTLTTATHQRRALFARTANAELLVKTLFHYRAQGRYLLHGFVVMPEHLHVLLTPSANQTVERCAQCIKGGFSHSLRAQFGGEVWQTGFHEHRIRDAEDFQNQLAYIAANPGKRGLAGHAFVHTRYLDQLDPTPERLLDARFNPSSG
ncbi:MAG: REP-associated tyrosine transposase [Terracidiphilus sp.]